MSEYKQIKLELRINKIAQEIEQLHECTNLSLPQIFERINIYLQSKNTRKGKLTKLQNRRLNMYFNGYTITEIARLEKVSVQAIRESLAYAGIKQYEKYKGVNYDLPEKLK